MVHTRVWLKICEPPGLLQEPLGPFGPEASPECPRECARNEGVSEGVSHEVSQGPFGPWAPECLKVPRVSPECPGHQEFLQVKALLSFCTNLWYSSSCGLIDGCQFLLLCNPSECSSIEKDTWRLMFPLCLPHPTQNPFCCVLWPLHGGPGSDQFSLPLRTK